MTPKPSAPDDVARFYDEQAESYATMMDAEISLPIYPDTLSRLAERIASIAGPVLDTSCGSGHMLRRYRDEYDSARGLIAIDLSPRMVAITRQRLGAAAEVFEADMRDLSKVGSESVAAVVSFFAMHHLGPSDAQVALREWHRVSKPGGQLVLATWEGRGPIDYGDRADVVALHHPRDDVHAWVEQAGFRVDSSKVERIEDMGMNALYVEATRR